MCNFSLPTPTCHTSVNPLRHTHVKNLTEIIRFVTAAFIADRLTRVIWKQNGNGDNEVAAQCAPSIDLGSFAAEFFPVFWSDLYMWVTKVTLFYGKEKLVILKKKLNSIWIFRELYSLAIENVSSRISFSSLTYKGGMNCWWSIALS